MRSTVYERTPPPGRFRLALVGRNGRSGLSRPRNRPKADRTRRRGRFRLVRRHSGRPTLVASARLTAPSFALPRCRPSRNALSRRRPRMAGPELVAVRRAVWPSRRTPQSAPVRTEAVDSWVRERPYRFGDQQRGPEPRSPKSRGRSQRCPSGHRRGRAEVTRMPRPRPQRRPRSGNGHFEASFARRLKERSLVGSTACV